MKKEVVVAIIIGFAIGLVITFGIYQAQKAYQATNQTPPTTSTAQTPTPPPTPNHAINLTSPANQAVIDTDSVSLIGLTSPSSHITAVSTTNQAFTQANLSGSFDLTFPLSPGPNLITLTSIDPAGTKTFTDLTVYYLKPTKSPTPESDEQP